jgi:hypothetical protein
MIIENLREMGKHNAESLAVAPGGQGGGTPAAGAPLYSAPALRLPQRVQSINPRRETDHPFTSETDHLDIEKIDTASVFTPPSRHSYSNDMPCSPPYPVMNCIPILNNILRGIDCRKNHSEHIAVTVDMDKSTLNNCARMDARAIGGIPGTDPQPSLEDGASWTDAATITNLRYIYSRKGATAWPRRYVRIRTR